MAYIKPVIRCPTNDSQNNNVAFVITYILLLKIKPINKVRKRKSWHHSLPAFQTGWVDKVASIMLSIHLLEGSYVVGVAMSATTLCSARVGFNNMVFASERSGVGLWSS